MTTTMPTETITSNAALTREHLRTFHLSGPAPGDAIPDGPLRPTILAELTGLPQLETFYPMCVHPDGSAQPFRNLVNELEHPSLIASAFQIAMAGHPSALLEEIAPDAIASLKECSGGELARLRKLLPAGAFLLAYHADSLLPLHAAALAEARRVQRNHFWDDVRRTAARLREMLTVDRTHAPNAVSAESVTASLGSRVGAFFNPGRLAKALQQTANPLKCMEPERRSRCESTLAILEEALHDSAGDPAFFLFHSGNAGAAAVLFDGAVKQAADSFAAALQFCDVHLDRLTQLLRALRVARLEINSAFEASLHQEMLARFDWQSASSEELVAIPPIIVLETVDRLAQASLTSFGRLLRSGRPVQILIARAGLEPQDLGGFSPDFGYLAIAHRESFVLQSSLAEPSHLLPGLAAMAGTQRPTVAVVSVPVDSPVDSNAWLADNILIQSRALPLYTYAPDAGSRWSERFRLFVPPPANLSAAHAAAVANHLQRYFRIIPASAWSSEQMELDDYLAAYQTRPPLAIPYIWVEGEGGIEQRALITRDLVNYCADRRRAWQLFEELSGLGQTQQVPNDQARQEGAKEALQQVIAMLQST